MTATDELRRMLTEAGVEYEGDERSLRWRDRNGVMMQAFPLANGELGMEVWSCTPAQAIAATLGAGTCHMTRIEDEERILCGWVECSECGPVYPPAAERIQDAIKYCPFCGRKVVDA